MKKFLSIALCLVMVFSFNIVAFGAEDNEIYDSDNALTQGVTDLTLEVVKADDILIATVPVEIPLVADTRGNVTVPTNLEIVNSTTDKTIYVSQITFSSPNNAIEVIIPMGSYTQEDREERMEKELEFDLNGVGGLDGYVKDNEIVIVYIDDANNKIADWTIQPDSSLPLTIQAALSKGLYSTEAAQYLIGTFSFTIAIIE